MRGQSSGGLLAWCVIGFVGLSVAAGIYGLRKLGDWAEHRRGSSDEPGVTPPRPTKPLPKGGQFPIGAGPVSVFVPDGYEHEYERDPDRHEYLVVRPAGQPDVRVSLSVMEPPIPTVPGDFGVGFVRNRAQVMGLTLHEVGDKAFVAETNRSSDGDRVTTHWVIGCGKLVVHIQMSAWGNLRDSAEVRHIAEKVIPSMIESLRK